MVGVASLIVDGGAPACHRALVVDWLNYHHLLYFWVVAREGGLAPASKVLRLSQSTLSGQIKKLEDTLDVELFHKRGRRLELTELGQAAFRHAGEIFGLGQELRELLRGRRPGGPLRLVVGISDVVPKLLVRRLLGPALAGPDAVSLVCHEDRHERLLADLAGHELDIVIADAPVPAGSAVRAYSHLLGESKVVVMGTAALTRPRRRGFPRSLDGAPMLLPLEGSSLRRQLNAWFSGLRVAPRVVAEAEDTALLTAFAADGMGLMVVPEVIADLIGRRYRLVRCGAIPGLDDRYYAISVEKRLVHPAVLAIRDAARDRLFAR